MKAGKLLLGIAALALSLRANANIIVSLEPSSQSISVGSPVSVNLVISGLGDHTSPSLGAFALDVTYNPLVLSVAGVGGLGNELAGLPGATVGSGFPSAGVFSVYAVSFESSGDLLSNQPSSFLLGVLEFTGISAGISALGVTGSLSDETGQISLQFQTTAGRVEVSGGAVSLPDASSNAGLLALGLACLFVLRPSPFRAIGHRGQTARRSSVAGI
jgi:hypothetical protein